MATQYNIFNIDERLEKLYTKEQISDAKENKTYDKMLEKLYSDLEKFENSLDDKLKTFDNNANKENNSDYKMFSRNKEDTENLMSVANFALTEEADYQAYKKDKPDEKDFEARQAFRGERDILVRAYMNEVEGRDGDYSEEDYSRLVTLAKEWDANKGNESEGETLQISDQVPVQEETPVNTEENSDEWQKRYYDQHKEVAESHAAKVSEPEYVNGGVSFEIDNDKITYDKPNSLKLGGATNLNALRATVLNAKKEGVSGIDFSKIQDPKNVERFYILAMAHGMTIAGLEKAPEVSKEELAKLSEEERKKYEVTQKQKEAEEKKKNEPKDYKTWKDKVDATVSKDGKNAVMDFSSVKHPEDQARLFLAAKVAGVKVANVDVEKLDYMSHIAELPKIDQMRLMVINKQENGAYKEKDSDFDKDRTERSSVKSVHKEKIGKTTQGTDERKTAVANRSAALEALKNRSR